MDRWKLFVTYKDHRRLYAPTIQIEANSVEEALQKGLTAVRVLLKIRKSSDIRVHYRIQRDVPLLKGQRGLRYSEGVRL